MWTHYNRLLLRGVRSEPPGPSGGGYHFRKKLKVLLSARFYRPILLFNPLINSSQFRAWSAGNIWRPEPTGVGVTMFKKSKSTSKSAPMLRWSVTIKSPHKTIHKLIPIPRVVGGQHVVDEFRHR